MKKTISCFILVGCFNLVHAEYALIIETGSHSQAHLFQYQTVPQALPVITEIFSERVMPGLAAYADHPERAGVSLKKILDDAGQVLKRHQVDEKTVSLNVLGTASMRLLSDETQKIIYANVVSYLKNNYAFSVDHVETLSGKQQGLYNWLAVNYLAGKFITNEKTLGVVEVSDVSTQIAFVIEDHTQSNDKITLNIFNNAYTVFSKSFLGLGVNTARTMMGQSENANACFPAHYPLNHFKVGNFSLAICGQEYRNVINSNYDKMVPWNNTMFVVLAAAYDAYSFFGVESPDKGSVESRIQWVCLMNWEDMKIEYEGEDETSLAARCANGVYVDQLLNYAYQIPPENLWVTNKIQGREIDWTVGALFFKLLA